MARTPAVRRGELDRSDRVPGSPYLAYMVGGMPLSYSHGIPARGWRRGSPTGWLAIAMRGTARCPLGRQRSCPRCSLAGKGTCLSQAPLPIRSRAFDHLAGLSSRLGPPWNWPGPPWRHARRLALPVAQLRGPSRPAHPWHRPAAPRIVPVLPGRWMRAGQGQCQPVSAWHHWLVSGSRRERCSPAWRAGRCWQIRLTAAPGMCRAARWRVRSRRTLRAAVRWLRSVGWIAARRGCWRWAGCRRGPTPGGPGRGAGRWRAERG
jgi:hypothetical protein